MHALSLGLLILAVAACARGHAAEWQSLFDGRTTAGWLEITGKPVPESCWRVEEGCLRAFAGTAGMQDIRTAETFAGFEFEFEWKLEAKGNSGVKYLLQKVDEWTPAGRGRQARARGFEYQLADDANEEARGDPRRSAGALYSALAPNPRIRPEIGAFNRSRIVVQGTQVEHWLNGTRVVAFDTGGPEALALLRSLAPKSGPSEFRHGSPISLQNHGTPVWFRNLRIRRGVSASWP